VAWWPPEVWERMTSGRDCPMCVDAALPENEHSDLVCERPFSYVRLHRNQTQPGYCVVIAKVHVAELHQMDPASLAGFWSDVAVVGRAVSDLFHPVKIDNLVMGHRCPHVHCHVYPQYPTDDPFQLVDISAGEVRSSDAERRKRLAEIRARIEGFSDRAEPERKGQRTTS
jgi:diadenosine tetraphosphate (Ap4A) HIT family hydrolase